MVQNAQLDNEKSAISYQVELYKDKFQDLEASYSVLQVSCAFCMLLFIFLVHHSFVESSICFLRRNTGTSAGNTIN